MRNATCGTWNNKSKIIRSRVWNLNSELRTPYSELQRGFTLIEIIIVIVILSIVSVITIKFLIDSLQIYTMTVNQKTLYDEGKLALERMCRDIRDAKSISSPASGSSGSSITFVRNNATAFDSGLPADTTGETIIFQRNAGASTLEKVKASPSATRTMADDVSSFTVTRGAAATSNLNQITLALTLSRTSGENVSLQTVVYPKNLLEDTSVPPTYKNFRVQDSGGTYASWQEVLSP